MKVYILALFFVAAQASSQFEVKDAKNVTCVMLDLAGTLSLEATEVNKTKVNATIDFAKAALIGDSNCTLLKLNLEEGKAQVWFKLSNTSLVVPEVSFNSSLALKVGNDIVTVQADPLKEVPQNHSYVCNASVDHKFHPAEASNYTFSVVASLQNFHIQFGGIKNDTFGPSEDCDEDKTTTTASPNTTATTVTTAAPTTPTTTAAPNEDVFVCKEGNTTRLRFEANMSLAITYETTSNKSVTIHVSVPLHTSNDSACTNQTEEVLNIRFLDDWVLTYVFERSTNTSENYYVSKISLVYNTTYFKDAKNNETLTVEYTGGSSYLSASEKEYYRCNANSTVKLSSNVTLSTVELKYRAFNKDGDITLSGDATECSADEETSSVVPIAVGAALAGLVVIVLIAYLIGRRRSRKSGYESV